MASPEFLIPAWLNFSCSGCGLCCRRGWVIQVNNADYERLHQYDWHENSSGRLAGCRLFASLGSAYRFAVSDAGCCNFLDSSQRCLIHKKLGYEAKVLACQLYPVNFVVCGNQVRVGVHFSCPAVVANTGSPLIGQKKMLRRLYKKFAAENQGLTLPVSEPDFDRKRKLPFALLAQLEAVIDHAFAEQGIPFLRRIIWSADIFDQLDSQYRSGMSEGEFVNILQYCNGRAREKSVNRGLKSYDLSFMETILLRLLTGLASEMAIQGLLASSFTVRQKARLKRLGLAISFITHRGNYALAERRGNFNLIAATGAYPLEREAEEMLMRYLRTRLAIRSYFGASGWGMGVLHGGRFLLSLYAVCIWLARMHAAASPESEAEKAVSINDICTGILLTDHTFGHMTSFQLPVVKQLLSTVNRPGWSQKAALYATLWAGGK